MAGRPLGATSSWRNLNNNAANHANLLLELWLCNAPLPEVQALVFYNPDHATLLAECWRARGAERRYTVPPRIKRALCRIASEHVTEMRRQAIMQQGIWATEINLRTEGWSDGQIAEIMSRRVPEAPHVEPPDIEKVLKIVNRRAPPGSLRRKAKDRVSHISPC